MQWNECSPFRRPKVVSLFRLRGYLVGFLFSESSPSLTFTIRTAVVSLLVARTEGKSEPPVPTVRAQARFRRQIGVLRSTVAVYIASNGGNDEEDCWMVCSFCKICQQGIVTSFREDDSGEAVLDLFTELSFERFYKAKGMFSKLFLNFLFDEETDGSHVLAHGALSGGAKWNRRSATRREILCGHIKGMKRDLEVWPIGRHKMFVVPGPLRRSTKGRDLLQERTIHSSFSCPKCRLWLAQRYWSPQT